MAVCLPQKPRRPPSKTLRLCRNCAGTLVHGCALIRKRPLGGGPLFQYFVYFCAFPYLSVPGLFGTQKPLGVIPCGLESRPRPRYRPGHSFGHFLFVFLGKRNAPVAKTAAAPFPGSRTISQPVNPLSYVAIRWRLSCGILNPVHRLNVSVLLDRAEIPQARSHLSGVLVPSFSSDPEAAVVWPRTVRAAVSH